MVLESLLRLSWDAFLRETERDPEMQVLRQAVVFATTKVRNDVASSTIQDLYQTKQLEERRERFAANKSSNKMCRYWQSYVDMVGLLLLFIRSIREGDWDLHLNCIGDMLPLMFA